MTANLILAGIAAALMLATFFTGYHLGQEDFAAELSGMADARRRRWRAAIAAGLRDPVYRLLVGVVLVLMMFSWLGWLTPEVAP